jgi:nitrilase
LLSGYPFWLSGTGAAAFDNPEQKAAYAYYLGAVGLTKDIARFIAMEGRVFCVAASCLLSLQDIPTDFPMYDRLTPEMVSFDGGSATAAPNGDWVVEPVADVEQLLVAEVDPAVVREARQNFDPTGHYSRPDVFDVQVNRQRLEAAHFID